MPRTAGGTTSLSREYDSHGKLPVVANKGGEDAEEA